MSKMEGMPPMVIRIPNVGLASPQPAPPPKKAPTRSSTSPIKRSPSMVHITLMQDNGATTTKTTSSDDDSDDDDDDFVARPSPGKSKSKGGAGKSPSRSPRKVADYFMPSTYPLARVKAIAKVDDRVTGSSPEATMLLAHAAEKFVDNFVEKTLELVPNLKKGKMIAYDTVADCVQEHEEMHFLKSLIPRRVRYSLVKDKGTRGTQEKPKSPAETRGVKEEDEEKSSTVTREASSQPPIN